MVDLYHSEEAGWDLLTALRQEAATQQIPVIGDRYFLKPFDLEELLRMIQELIGDA
jgi:hypothetical protein